MLSAKQHLHSLDDVLSRRWTSRHFTGRPNSQSEITTPAVFLSTRKPFSCASKSRSVTRKVVESGRLQALRRLCGCFPRRGLHCLCHGTCRGSHFLSRVAFASSWLLQNSRREEISSPLLMPWVCQVGMWWECEEKVKQLLPFHALQSLTVKASTFRVDWQVIWNKI